ncbi:hypothetical protein NHX12_022782 [Muraenolepis orangiensis]|uniref:Integrase zinc-binding domain-containing protein n=1 Tax=Muraenolepis orangiensis TaxID=630683 RepID=A0A9Q0IUD9_9TELE|nr:hypothetical protein NHX12_022782 [Muraenolepis orangiensis]
MERASWQRKAGARNKSVKPATVRGQAEDVDENPGDEKVVHAMEATDVLSTETLSQLKEATDSVLQAVCDKNRTGWPKKRCSVDRSLHSYWPMWHNISLKNGIMMVGDKIIVPQSFKKVIVEKLHLAHQGIQRTKAKARRVLTRNGT